MLRRYFWDFFGPRAEPTAAHFQAHLAERLSQDGFADVATGQLSAGDDHSAAFCDAAEPAWAHIERSLRPARYEPL